MAEENPAAAIADSAAAQAAGEAQSAAGETHAATEAGHSADHPTFLGLDSYAWVGAAFLCFVLLLWKLGAFRMIGTSLDAQAEKVKADLAEAAQLKAEAEAMKAKAAAD